MRKIMKPSIVMPLITMITLLAAVVSVTWAWVSMNNHLDSTGISMNVNVSANLVISDSASAIAAYTTSGWKDSYVEKMWSDDTRELIPVDHYDSATYPVVSGSDSVGLVYNDNPVNVVRTTGKGNNLTFSHVPSDGVGTYFIDKVVYVASLKTAMTKGTDYSRLTFSITETGSGTTVNTAYKSASVDVYVANVYKGTLNLDQLGSFSVTDVDSVPLNTAGSLAITFRCYFDGALQNASDNTKNYVNSTVLATNTADISFDITITAE